MDKQKDPIVQEELDMVNVDYDKIVKLLASGEASSIALAMTVLRKVHPAMWTALAGYIGTEPVTEDLIKQLSRQGMVNIGHKVKYRGLDESPVMVITAMQIQNAKSSVGDRYFTTAECKYFNKSKQEFCTVKDRLECFEVL